MPIVLYSPHSNMATPITSQPQSNVVIVNNQIGGPRGQLKPWNNGLFGCFKNFTHCLCTCFFPCCYAGMQAQRMGEGFLGGCCLYSGSVLSMRAAIRHKHNIEGDLCTDCCCQTFCGPCSQCQLYNEMDDLGY